MSDKTYITLPFESIRKVLIAGNHAANVLIQWGITKPEKVQDPLHELGMEASDVWYCWKAAMDLRDAVNEVNGIKGD